MRRIFRFILLGLVLVLVAMMSALTAMRLAIHGREVSVPRLVGMTGAEAERVATASGLLVERESRFFSAEVPEGRVVSQLPAPGTRVRRGWRVRIAESLGPQRAVIPNLVGQSPRAAEINVRRRGLEVGSVATIHLAGEPGDQVVAQSPPAQADAVSPKVNLLVAAEPEQAAYVMPSFVGRHLADVAPLVEQAGLRLVDTTTASVPNVAPTTILRQSPAPGQKVTAGTTVSFEVAK